MPARKPTPSSSHSDQRRGRRPRGAAHRADVPVATAPSIRWRPVAALVAAVMGGLLVLVYVAGWWPPPEESIRPVPPGPAEAAIQPPRLAELPLEAEYPDVETLQAEIEQISQDLRTRFPDSGNAYHIAASQATQRRQFDDAARWWARAIELAPQFVVPRTGFASVQIEQGNARAAITTLQQALDDDLHTAMVYVLLASAYQETGDLERALEVANQGLSRYPEDAEILHQRGQVYLQLHSLAEARADLEQVVAARPEVAAVHSTLATILARLGEVELAAEHREKQEALKQSDPLAGHEFDEIYRAALQRIVVNTLVDAAGEYLSQGDAAAAERSLLRVLELHPQNAAACKLLVTIYRQQQRPQDAFLVQHRLVQIDPTANHWINLASLAVTLEAYREAEAALEQALQLDPRSVLAYRALAMLDVQTGRWQDARRHAELACEYGDAAQDYQLLGRICLRLNDEAGYQQALERAGAATR